MKWFLSLILAAVICLPSQASFIYTAPAAGSLNDPLLTGTIDLFGGQTLITDGGDRTVFRGDVFEFKNLAGDRNCIYIHTPGVHPQFTVTGCDLWFETTDGGGASGSIAALAQNVDVGYSTYQQDEITGFSPIRHLAMYGTQVFIPWAERASHTLGSMASVMKHTQGGTVAGGSQGIATTNINYWTWSNSGSGRYIEHYLGGSGLFFTQQNIDFELNYESGKGRLIIADSNAAANGLRLKSFTLSGGTVVETNSSITAKSVIFHGALNSGSAALSNQGQLSFKINAGVGFTVYSTDASDANTYYYWVVENGRP